MKPNTFQTEPVNRYMQWLKINVRSQHMQFELYTLLLGSSSLFLSYGVSVTLSTAEDTYRRTSDQKWTITELT